MMPMAAPVACMSVRNQAPFAGTVKRGKSARLLDPVASRPDAENRDWPGASDPAVLLAQRG